MADTLPQFDPDDPVAIACYQDAVRALRDADVPFLVGGAYAFARYTGIARHTKDLDVFLRQADCPRALAALSAAGFRTERTYTHWLAKAIREHHFIDLIHGSGNGAVPVDDAWFEHAVECQVFGEPVLLCPAEESLWSKAFIMERNRFDGADINHLVWAYGHRMDWRRLVDRFGPHWRVLLAHLILFGFAYPAERDRVPAWVVWELTARLHAEVTAPPPDDRVCQGTLLAAAQYLPDVERFGYADARLEPHGTMTPEQIEVWTDGVLTGR